MNILIKGMEMPKSCYKCPLKRRESMTIVCPVAHEMFSVADVNFIDYRLKNCPLIPVPPHGRLIDADVLRNMCDDPYWCVWLSEIDDSPTIIPSDKEDTTNENNQN